MKKVDFKMKFVVGSAAIQDTDKKAKGENNDCFVRAVMNACQVSYDEAHELVATKFGRQRGKGTMGAPMKLKTMATAGEKLAQYDIRSLGYYAAIPMTPEHAKERGVLLNLKYPKGGGTYSGFTVGKFLAQHPKGSYIVIVAKHALAIRDGKIYDNADQLDALFLTKGRDQRKCVAVFQLD